MLLPVFRQRCPRDMTSPRTGFWFIEDHRLRMFTKSHLLSIHYRPLPTLLYLLNLSWSVANFRLTTRVQPPATQLSHVFRIHMPRLAPVPSILLPRLPSRSRVCTHIVELLEADLRWNPLRWTTVACNEHAMSIYTFTMAGIVGRYDDVLRKRMGVLVFVSNGHHMVSHWRLS